MDTGDCSDCFGPFFNIEKNNKMKKKRIWTAGLFALLLAAGCDNSSEIVEGQEPDKGPVQEFTLMVETYALLSLIISVFLVLFA